MKIAQCLEYPLALRGGVSVVVEALSAELAQRGHKIILVSPDTAERLHDSNSHDFIEQHIAWKPGESSSATARKVAQKIKAAGVDIAHFHAGGNYGWNNRFPFRSPAYYLKQLGVPILWTSHRAEAILDGFCGPEKPLLFKLLLLPIAWMGKLQQLHCSQFEVAVSQNNLIKLKRWYAPLRSRFVQIYHSRLNDTQPPDEFVKREPEILTVGHLAAVKGQTVLLDAFQRIAQNHPEFKLLVAGHGGADGTLDRMQKVITEHHLEKQVVLLGERSDAQALMRRATIYVQPSLNEALGLALQEAMFCGCAAIGTRVGGIPELIEDGKTGALVAPGNVSELSTNLERLIRQPELVRRWGAEAAKSIRNRGMTLKGMTDRYLQLYEKATQDTRRKA
jgi:glycosyltransferase involved in cell wall biosynthesis